MIHKDSTSEIRQLHFQVKKWLDENCPDEEIVNRLQKQGVEPYYARTVIDNIHEEKQNGKSFRNAMIMGSFYIIGGLLVNYYSYQLASTSNSTTFFLFWGIVVWGIITVSEALFYIKDDTTKMPLIWYIRLHMN